MGHLRSLLHTLLNTVFSATGDEDKVDERIAVKPVNWVWHPDSDGPKPQDETKEGESGEGSNEGDKDPSLEDFDKEMREKAEPLMSAHKMGAEDLETGQQTWRCVPMDQIDEKGQEVAAQNGAALFGMKAMPSGKIGIEVPFRPPIYNPVVGPPEWPSGGVCPKGVEGCYRQILRDPNGLWYWVLTGKGEVARSERKLIKISDWPARFAQRTGSNMVCHHAEEHEFDDNPLLAPGVHAMDQFHVKPEAVPDLPATLTSFLSLGVPSRLGSFLSVGPLTLQRH
mmetsp:Transcript_57691/g.101017  ORF Transcript_57691/g.101017 Transcript_57691/m.101017 type:complete len:282 (+) Transcript_57691:192-1037(+)